MEFKIKYEFETEIKADNKEQALSELEERFAVCNTTAENEFWNNLEIKEMI